MELEYIALLGANKEAIALNNILFFIKKGIGKTIFFLNIIPLIFIDNKAAIVLLKTNTFYKKAKHIEIHYYSI